MTMVLSIRSPNSSLRGKIDREKLRGTSQQGTRASDRAAHNAAPNALNNAKRQGGISQASGTISVR